MNYKTSLLSLCAVIILTGCNDIAKESVEQENQIVTHKSIVQEEKTPKNIVKKDYTIDEIYNEMCITCHNSDGSCNTEKLTPALKDATEIEILTALKEIEDEDAKHHIIMKHNHDQILKMGMNYKAEEMAQYMFKRFNK